MKKKKKKKIYLPNESHIKLNQINAKGGLPELGANAHQRWPPI